MPQAVAIDSNSNVAVVANSGEDSVSIVDLGSQKVTATIRGIPSAAGVAINPLGLAVVASKSTNSVAIVDVALRRVRTTLSVGSAPVGVAVNPNTNVAVVANSTGYSVSIIDLNAVQLLGTVQGIPSPSGLQSVAIDPDLNMAAIASSGGNALFLVDLAKRQIAGQIQLAASPSGVAIDRQSKTAVVALENSSVALVDLSSKSVRTTISGINGPQAVAISPATRSALVTTGRNGTLEVISLTTATIENTISNLAGGSGVAFNTNTGVTVVALSLLNSVAIVPSLELFSMVNAASFVPGPVGQSSIVSGFGSALSASTGSATGLPLPTTLQDVTVRVNNTPAPLFFVSPSQINFQVPRLAPGTYKVQVLRSGLQVASGILAVVPASPALFTDNQQGSGQVAALNEDGRPNGQAPPDNLADSSGRRLAARGAAVQFFGTGGGTTNPDPPAGAAATDAAPTVAVPTALIGGLPAEVLYSGASPGLVGVWQVNLRVPPAVRPGPAVPVVISQNGRNSNTATIAVE